MKKVLMAAMAVIVATSLLAVPKDDSAAAWKFAKRQAKELTKEGWKVDGIYTMEEAFYKYRIELQKDENNRELTGLAAGTTSSRTINQAKQWATNNAAITYSKEAGMSIRGRINSDIGSGIDAASLDNFYEGYESLVQKEIKGELHMKFGIYREKKDGSIEYQAYYIVNEENAAKARLRALESMKKESEFARQHAEEISQFVREGFQQGLGE